MVSSWCFLFSFSYRTITKISSVGRASLSLTPLLFFFLCRGTVDEEYEEVVEVRNVIVSRGRRRLRLLFFSTRFLSIFFPLVADRMPIMWLVNKRLWRRSSLLWKTKKKKIERKSRKTRRSWSRKRTRMKSWKVRCANETVQSATKDSSRYH
jgi:hypothetical protein